MNYNLNLILHLQNIPLLSPSQNLPHILYLNAQFVILLTFKKSFFQNHVTTLMMSVKKATLNLL